MRHMALSVGCSYSSRRTRALSQELNALEMSTCNSARSRVGVSQRVLQRVHDPLCTAAHADAQLIWSEQRSSVLQ